MASCRIGMVGCFKRCYEAGLMIPMMYVENYNGQLFISSVFD